MKSLIFLLLFSNITLAKQDKNIPQIMNIEAQNYSLCREHTIRYAYVIKIAYVGLYLKDCSLEQGVLNLSDKIIRFNYVVDVKAEVFIDAAKEFFIKNAKAQLENQELQALNDFNQLYENIDKSEYYDLYHQQGKTLKLFKNTKLLGVIENSSFAANYFNIWFGKEPAVKSLKKAFSI